MNINFSISRIFNYLNKGKSINISLFTKKNNTNSGIYIDIKRNRLLNSFFCIRSLRKKKKYPLIYNYNDINNINSINNSIKIFKSSNFYQIKKSNFSTITKIKTNTNTNTNKEINPNQDLNDMEEDFILDKMTDMQKQYYFYDLKNFYFDFNFGPKFKFLYFGAHISTLYFIVITNNFLQFYWFYQCFYGWTMFSIAYFNYEVYSNLNEKKTLDRFIKLM